MEYEPKDWVRVGKEIELRMKELSLTKAEVIRGGISGKTLDAYLAGAPIKRADKRRELSAVLRWSTDSIQLILEGGRPVSFGSVEFLERAPAQGAHDGSDGWPAWLEDWLTGQISLIRGEVEKIASRVEGLARQLEQQEPSA